MLTVCKRDLKVWFSGLFGYAAVAVPLFFAGLFLSVQNLLTLSSDLSTVLFSMQWVLCLWIPFLTAYTQAGEWDCGRVRVLLSLPLSSASILLGRFAALLALVTLHVAALALYPLLLSSLGSLSMGAAYTALLGYWMQCILLLALCFLISLLSRRRMLAFLISFLALAGLFAIGLTARFLPRTAWFSILFALLVSVGGGALAWRYAKSRAMGVCATAALALSAALLFLFFPQRLSGMAPTCLELLSPFDRFEGFSYGYFDIPGAVFYLAATAALLFLAVRVIEARRYGEGRDAR